MCAVGYLGEPSGSSAALALGGRPLSAASDPLGDNAAALAPGGAARTSSPLAGGGLGAGALGFATKCRDGRVCRVWGFL